MPKIAELLIKVVNPSIDFRIDPDEVSDIQNEKHFQDIVTPYEQDHKAEGFRKSLVSACNEVKGLNASCLTLGEQERFKALRRKGKVIGL
jgi:thymidine kinase